ncbi:helix-turn-helix transcriptional regulator [Croceicoccus sp. F390]|uniref:Helix-turn-helix transcriptional regulator n=1 Tax=Croceicoccus esteveae TaxID=3075597 RepID=A0ABU2ZIX2_9SPHN|nr:helix-turn-helix transcriptional regulator [Croceicoccus sp. F390]MDT0576545.1 helix-turn-helix transcriptional regulator [Croceicoccus sp. F390]
MINRIRAVRQGQGLTLAELAERCSPPTTAQTVGRLETGMRTLSIDWLNRLAGALDVSPQMLLSHVDDEPSMVIAVLDGAGAEALTRTREAIAPTSLMGGPAISMIEVTGSVGEYRTGDQIWVRKVALEDATRATNRDVLVPRTSGRYVFGRLLDQNATSICVSPHGVGQEPITMPAPPWMAVAVLLTRPL